MLPLITAALGLLQKKSKDNEDRKQMNVKAALGEAPEISAPQDKGAGLSGLAGSLLGGEGGGMLGGLMGGGAKDAVSETPTGSPLYDNKASGVGGMSQGTNALLDNALGGLKDNDEDDLDGYLK